LEFVHWYFPFELHPLFHGVLGGTHVSTNIHGVASEVALTGRELIFFLTVGRRFFRGSPSEWDKVGIADVEPVHERNPIALLFQAARIAEREQDETEVVRAPW
jgi:hypothetical protein